MKQPRVPGLLQLSGGEHRYDPLALLGRRTLVDLAHYRCRNVTVAVVSHRLRYGLVDRLLVCHLSTDLRLGYVDTSLGPGSLARSLADDRADLRAP